MAENATSAAGIEIRSLYKVFGANAARAVELVKAGMSKAELNEKHGNVLGLKDINLEMPGGCIQVIMGLSGSGKSTLIRHINRLIDPTAGEVLVGGADVVKMNEKELREFRRKNTAMVFQKFALLPHRTVLDNAVYGLQIQGVPRKTQVEQAMRWIERVGLSGFENRYPNQLSGGMQQRVGLARALTNDAPILLMDEAFSALDPLIRTDMQGVLLDLQKEIKKTIVFITHDLDEALRLGDRIAILRDGEVIQQGTGQDIVLRPADPYIEKFVKEVNRARIVYASSVMTPLNGAAPAGLAIAADATLEDALREMVQADVRAAHVLGRDGKPAGALTLHAVASAMVTPPHMTEGAGV
ncbi:MAG: proline/glycine betaine ABC transporter ATP-binding protein [Kaistia sp. SCN 65-12]|nr:MAG: proline/glycine betaine ABC transporter ATP-binding protein [Kaistia sp. SCN 65-12]